MSLKNIRLTPNMLAGLYATSLVIDSEVHQTAAAKVIQQENRKTKYLGNHAKKVMIGVNNPGISFLPDDDLNLLTSMLSACKLSLDDVAIVNTANTDGNALHKELMSRIVLLFGIGPVDFGLPVNFPEFQVQQLNGITYLYSPSLKQLNEDLKLKRKLWDTLKRIFNI